MKTGVVLRAVLLVIIACLCVYLLWRFAVQPFIASSSNAPGLHPLALIGPDGHETDLSVEWATTPDEQEKGLMYRTQVDHGMLFIFPAQQPLNFWMKNTLVPLDIAFFDSQDAFVSSARMLPCTGDPCAQYPSSGPAMYALEMSGGFLTQSGIGQGWHIRP